MKKAVIFMLSLAVLFLSACSPSASAPSYYTDCQRGLYSSYEPGRCVAEAEQGFYISSGALLYFLDTGTAAAYPVCSRPNCEHGEDAACHAFFRPLEGDMTPVFYSGGQLYVVSIAAGEIKSKDCIRLTQVSPDGAVRKELYSFSYDEIASSYVFAVHRGYCYVILQQITVDGSEYVIRRYPLAQRGEGETLISSADTPQYTRFMHLYAAGESLYFRAETRETREDVSLRMPLDGRGGVQRLLDIGDEKHGTGETRVIGGRLFTTLADNDAREAAFRARKTNYLEGYTQKEGETPAFFAVIPQGLIVTDDRYVYELDTPYLPYDVPHALRIYGEDGTLLLEEEMEIPDYWAIRVGRETVLVSEKNGKRYWYFDKSDIERGSLNWRSAALSPD